MLANIINVPSTPAEIMHWSFSHADAHVKIVNAIFNNYGIALPVFVLDPMPTDFNSDDMTLWQQIHQAAHSDFESILGIGGNDLSTVDFSKEDQIQSWTRLHWDAHNSAQLSTNYPD